MSIFILEKAFMGNFKKPIKYALEKILGRSSSTPH